MTGPSIEDTYAKYLASNKGDDIREVVTLEIYHIYTAAPLETFRYFFCDGLEDFGAKDENGNDRIFKAVPINFGTESVKNSTEQVRTITIDALEGSVYSEAKTLTVQERFDPVRVIVRTYRSNYRGGPAITPPPEYIVGKTTADAGRVTLELTSTFPRQRRCGQYATINRLPWLPYA